MAEIIEQEKTDEELMEVSSEIIDLLKDFNIAEKYKVISTLFDSLKDTIKSEGTGIIEITRKDDT